MADAINPQHYKSHPSGVQCIELARHLDFRLGNAVKYVWRAVDKNGVEDLRKAKWYLEDLIHHPPSVLSVLDVDRYGDLVEQVRTADDPCPERSDMLVQLLRISFGDKDNIRASLREAVEDLTNWIEEYE